jgi:hypothetical protein
MNTQRIGNFEFQLNRNGRPYQAIAYFCFRSGDRLTDCTQCEHYDPVYVEQSMLEWYNGAFLQMQDRIVKVGMLNDNALGVDNSEDAGD